VLIVVYSLAMLGDVWRGRAPAAAPGH
jgi:hypothetical protein